MPSTNSSDVSIVCDSSTVITPSLPTFYIASAMIPPMAASPLAEIAPTCLIAFAEDRLGQHGRRGRPVARHIGSLRGDLTHHLCAHILQRVFQLNLFRNRHAVFGNRRRAESLVNDDVTSPWA